MAKRSRKKQAERKDFQKVKFKVGKQKPKGLNVTDTSFKSHAINIVDQFQASSSTTTSARGLDIKKICSLLSHHTASQRIFALAELSDYLERYPFSVPVHLADILNAVFPRLMDEEHRVHSRIHVVLQSLLEKLGAPSRTLLEPFAGLILNYLICSVTHVNFPIAANALSVVDLVVSSVNLKAAGEDGRKLVSALMSMLCVVTESRKAGKKVQLSSTGYFASSQERVIVMARILKVVEALCSVDSDEMDKCRSVSWNAENPTTFMLRNPLSVDLTPKAVVLDLGFGDQHADAVSSPQEQLVRLLNDASTLVTVYWPTVADKPDEGTVSILDLVGRRICQDILKAALNQVNAFIASEDLRQYHDISLIFFAAVKTVTPENFFRQKSVSSNKYRKQLDKFADVLTRMDRPEIRNGSGNFPMLNRNALEVLRSYETFCVVTQASEETLVKVRHEIRKLEKHSMQTGKKKAKNVAEATSNPAFAEGGVH